MNENGVVNDMSAPGLAGLPRRDGKKPIIAAVNGITMGGGFEMVANCDMVVASTSAIFALPEAQRCTDLALTGRSVDARTMYDWGLVTRLVDAPANVVDAAVKVADEMCSNSPDSLFVGRRGIRLSWETGNVEEAVSTLAEQWYPRLVEGANFAEGIRAFTEKRSPKWVNSKL
jgi:enoyl-CoA hydratase/carnithine racemase